MKRMESHRHNLLIVLGILVVSLSKSEALRLPNELFHDEFESQRSSAKQPSAIDRRDAVRIRDKDFIPSTEKSPSSFKYDGDSKLSSIPWRHKTMPETKIESISKRRKDHSKPVKDTLDRTHAGRKEHSIYSDFGDVSKKVRPEVYDYESERTKKTQNRKNLKNDFERKGRNQSKYFHIKRSGDMATSSSNDTADGLAINNPLEESTPLNNSTKQNKSVLENRSQNQSNKSPEEIHLFQDGKHSEKVANSKTITIDENLNLNENNTNWRKANNGSSSENNKKRRRKVLRTKHRRKNNNSTETNETGLTVAFESGNPSRKHSSLLLPESTTRGSSISVVNENENKSTTPNTDDSTSSKIKIFSNKTNRKKSKPTLKQDDFLRKPLRKVVEKQIDENESPRENSKSYNTFPQNKTETSLSVLSNETLKHEYKDEDQIWTQFRNTDGTLINKDKYPKGNANSGDKNPKSRIQIVFNDHFNKSSNHTLKEKDLSTTYSRINGEKSTNKHNYTEEIPIPDWIPMHKSENFNKSDGNYMLSFNYKGDQKDQPKDIIKLSRELPKKAQDFPEKKTFSKKPEKQTTGETVSRKTKKQEVMTKKTPKLENFEFSKRLKVLPNKDETYKENFRSENHENDHLSALNKAPVSFKRKPKKQPTEAIWTPAKVEENLPDEQTPSRSKSNNLRKLNIDDSFFEVDNNKSPYPNTNDYVAKSFPKPHEQRKVTKQNSAEKSKVIFNRAPLLHPKSQPVTSSKENGKYFMHMFKRVGDLSLEHFDSNRAKTSIGDGYMSSIKLSWNDDDTRAQVETSVDSRMQPYLPSPSSDSRFSSTEQDTQISKGSVQKAFPLRRWSNEPKATRKSKPAQLPKQNETISRRRRSTKMKDKHFFKSHFTMGESRPTQFPTTTHHKKTYDHSTEQKAIPDESEIINAAEPIQTNYPRARNTEPQPVTKTYKHHTNPEVRSYYIKPMDSNESEKLTQEFHADKLHFPFDSYERPARETKNVELLQIYQVPKRTAYQKPKPKVLYGNVQERKNIPIFPRTLKLKTLAKPTRNTTKVFISHSYKGAPSETKIFRYSSKLTPSIVREQKKYNVSLGLGGKASRNEKASDADKSTSYSRFDKQEDKLKRPKIIRRVGPSESTNHRHPFFNKKVKTLEEGKDKNEFNRLQNMNKVENTTDSHKVVDQDWVRHAESQQRKHLSSDNDDSITYTYSKGPTNVDNSRYSKSAFSFEKDSWEHGFKVPEARDNYPRYSTIPQTNFVCIGKNTGYYADPEAGCQVFHMCQGTGEKHSFLCPNSTVFNQVLLVCDWYSKVNCGKSESFYNVNDRIYSQESNLNENKNDYENDIDDNRNWNTQQVRSYDENPKIRTENTMRSGHKKWHEPQARSSYNNDVSTSRKVKSMKNDKESINLFAPRFQDTRNAFQTVNSLPESTSKDILTGAFDNTQYKNANKVYVDNTIKTTRKPMYRSTAKTQTVSNGYNLIVNKTRPRAFHYFKEDGYSVIHDEAKPHSGHQTFIPETSTYGENNEKRNSWDSSKLEKTIQYETQIMPELKNEFKETQHADYQDIRLRKYPLRQTLKSSTKLKKTPLRIDDSYATAEPQRKEGPFVTNDEILSGNKNENPLITYRNTKIRDMDSRKSTKSTNLKLPFVKKELDKKKFTSESTTDTASYPIYKKQKLPLFDGKTSKEKKFENIKKQSSLKALPRTGMSRNNPDYNLGDSNYKSNLSSQSYNRNVSHYRYPLPALIRKTGPSKEQAYGYRIDDSTRIHLQDEQKSPKRMEKPKDDSESRTSFHVLKKTTPTANVTSRIVDILSGIETLGSDVSKILDGKDHIYKNIQVHKLKPSKVSDSVISINYKPFIPEKFLNTTNSLKHKDKGIRESLPSLELYPKTLQNFDAEINTQIHVKNIILDNVQEIISKSNNYSTDSSPQIGITDASTVPFPKDTAHESNGIRTADSDGLQKNNFPQKSRFSKTKNEQLSPAQSVIISPLNQTDFKLIGIEPKVKYNLRIFKDTSLNQKKTQPEQKQQSYHEERDPKIASESKESLTEIRNVPNERNIKSSVNYPQEQKVNINHPPFNNKKSNSDNGHIFTPKHISLAANSANVIPPQTPIDRKKIRHNPTNLSSTNPTLKVTHSIVNEKTNHSIYDSHNNKNKDKERFLPGARGTFPYIKTLPRQVVEPAPNKGKYRTRPKPEHKEPLHSIKEKLPAFIFTVNPYSDRPLSSKTKKVEQKPYILHRTTSKPALNPTSKQNSKSSYAKFAQETDEDYDSSDAESGESSEFTRSNEDPGMLQLGKDGPRHGTIKAVHLENNKQTQTYGYEGGRTVRKPSIQDGVREHRPYKGQGVNERKRDRKESSKAGSGPIAPTFKGSPVLVDGFVQQPKIISHQPFADFEEDTPHAKSISKISEILRKRGQLPAKPIQLFEGHKFLRPVISTEFMPRKTKLSRHQTNDSLTQAHKSQHNEKQNVKLADKTPINSENSSEETPNYSVENRHSKYADIERAAELEAERMIKSTTQTHE